MPNRKRQTELFALFRKIFPPNLYNANNYCEHRMSHEQGETPVTVGYRITKDGHFEIVYQLGSKTERHRIHNFSEVALVTNKLHLAHASSIRKHKEMKENERKAPQAEGEQP